MHPIKLHKWQCPMVSHQIRHYCTDSTPRMQSFCLLCQKCELSISFKSILLQKHNNQWIYNGTSDKSLDGIKEFYVKCPTTSWKEKAPITTTKIVRMSTISDVKAIWNETQFRPKYLEGILRGSGNIKHNNHPKECDLKDLR